MKHIWNISIFVILAIAGLFIYQTAFAVSTDVVTVKGTFTNITRPNVTLKTSEGTEYLIHLGPYWYWEDNGYSITLNSEAEVYGRLEQGNEIYAYKITQEGRTIQLVDDSNNPLWWQTKKGKGKGWSMGSGRGMGNGRGNCLRWK
jgi:hypothetical protein